MMEEWKEYKASEFCKTVTDGTHDSPKPKDKGHYLITSKHLKDTEIDFSSANYISEDDYFKIIARSKVEQYDILYSMIGTIGNIVQVKAEHVDFAVKNMGIFKMGGDHLNSSWLFYWLKTPFAHEFVSQRLAGSTQSYLTLNSLRDFPVKFPGKLKAREIISILSSLDDKIELNRRINANLEAQAQALFKSWFVDFEPFRDGEFVESELGMIPKGWRVGTLFDIAEILDKFRKPLSGKEREFMDKIYPYYGATSCMDYVDNYLFDGIYTLIGEDGSVVKEDGLPYMQYVWGKFWVNNHAHILQGKNGFSTEMIHVMLSITNIQHLVTGAVQAKLSQANMQKILVPIPPHDVLDNIRAVIDKQYEIKRNKEDESHRLATLRDTLLPRLMSGELKVNEIEREIQ